MTDQGVVIIVDTNASAARLAEAFAAEGYASVRVRSMPVSPTGAPHPLDQQSTYADTIVHRDSLAETLAAVAAYHPIGVVPGAELGVELADQLSEALGLPTNGTDGSYARRTKDAQIEAVRAAGLPTAQQLSVTDEDELAEWHRQIGGRVVVKPIRSARNDGVTVCAMPSDSVAAYRKIASSSNVYGIRNEGVVAQEYLSGTEYIVNTVSCQGRHRPTDLWEYTKISVNDIRDRINGMVTLAPDGPHWDELCAYSFAVLDALDIRFGPTHLEVMLTADGPRLVEAGARLCGEDVARYAELATGESQIDRTVQMILDPDRFLADCDGPYRRNEHAAMLFMASPYTGVLRSYPLMPLVEQLPSFRGASIKVHPGDLLRQTVDDGSEPLAIGLAHADETTLRQDFTTMIYLDGYGFYDVETA